MLLSTISFRNAFRSPGAGGLPVFSLLFFFRCRAFVSLGVEVEKVEIVDGNRYTCCIFAEEALIVGDGLNKHFQHVLVAIDAENRLDGIYRSEALSTISALKHQIKAS